VHRALALAATLMFGAATAYTAHAAPDNTLGVAILGVHVEQNGTFIDATGVTGVDHNGRGTAYQVTFVRDVSNCLYAATPFFAVHAVAVGPVVGQPEVVQVNVRAAGDSNAFLVEAEFYLLVYCPR